MENSLTKKAVTVFKVSANDVSQIYRSQKSDIENTLKMGNVNYTPSAYNSTIAMIYAIIQTPPTVFKRIFGTLPGMVFSMGYSILISPLRAILSLFDLRTLKNFFLTIFYFVVECLPKAISDLVTGMFSKIHEYMMIIAKAIDGDQKVQSCLKRQMLTESKANTLRGKIWSWFKNALSKAASMVKTSIFFFVRHGFAVFEKPFMKFVYPIAQCMSKNNRLRGHFGSLFVGKSASMLASLAKTLGISSVVMVGGTLSLGGGPVVAGLMSFVVFMGYVSYAFAFAGYLSLAGQFIELKNVIVGAFS